MLIFITFFLELFLNCTKLCKTLYVYFLSGKQNIFFQTIKICMIYTDYAYQNFLRAVICVVVIILVVTLILPSVQES